MGSDSFLSSAANQDADAALAAAADQQLLAGLRRGDGAAFEQLIRDHGRPLLATARRMLGNEEDARDAFQEAMLAVFKAAAEFEGRSRLATWLHRILLNSVLMKLRRSRCRPECSIEDLLPRFQPDGHHYEPPCPWSDRAGEELDRAENKTLLWAALDRLPAAYREVIVLRDIEDLSTEAAAQVLGVTANAVKIRLHRARQGLRTLLDRHYQEAPR